MDDKEKILLILILEDILLYYKQGKYDSFFHELGYAIANNELTIQECFNFIDILKNHNNINEDIIELIQLIKNHE